MKLDRLDVEKKHTTKTYFTGKPCKRGHIAERLVSTAHCLACARESYKRLKSEDYYNKRLDKEKAFIATKKWREKNRIKVRAWVNERYNRSRTLQPASILYSNEIRQIYRDCPEGFQVDHIIPLKGKNVCGLHVPWNLQYLTPEENNKKRNKLVD